MKCKVCKEGVLTFAYLDGVEVWKCSNCGRLHKRIKGTDECEPLVSEHKTEFVPPDRETIQDATGKKTSGVYVK